MCGDHKHHEEYHEHGVTVVTGGQSFPELPQFTRQIVIGPQRTDDGTNDASAAFAGLLHPFTGVLDTGLPVGTWPSTVLSHLTLNWNAENVGSSLTDPGFDEATVTDTLRTVEPSDDEQGGKPWTGDPGSRFETMGQKTEDGELKAEDGEQRVRDLIHHERSESQTDAGDSPAERDPAVEAISRPAADERPVVPQVTDTIDRPTDGIRSARPIARLVHQLVPPISSNWAPEPSVGDDESQGRLTGKDGPLKQSVDEVESSLPVAHSRDSTQSNRSRSSVLTGRGSLGTVPEELDLTSKAGDDQVSVRTPDRMELFAPSRRTPSRQSQRQRDATGDGHEHLSGRVEPDGPDSSTDSPRLSVRHSRTDVDRHSELEDERRAVDEAGGPADSPSTASRPSIDPSSRIEERIDIERLADRLARTLERRDRIERERRGR